MESQRLSRQSLARLREQAMERCQRPSQSSQGMSTMLQRRRGMFCSGERVAWPWVCFCGIAYTIGATSQPGSYAFGITAQNRPWAGAAGPSKRCKSIASRVWMCAVLVLEALEDRRFSNRKKAASPHRIEQVLGSLQCSRLLCRCTSMQNSPLPRRQCKGKTRRQEGQKDRKGNKRPEDHVSTRPGMLEYHSESRTPKIPGPLAPTPVRNTDRRPLSMQSSLAETTRGSAAPCLLAAFVFLKPGARASLGHWAICCASCRRSRTPPVIVTEHRCRLSFSHVCATFCDGRSRPRTVSNA